MSRNGYSEQVAMSVSGHKTTSMFRRYNIVSLEDQKRAAAKRIEAIKAQREAGTTHTRHSKVANLKDNE